MSEIPQPPAPPERPVDPGTDRPARRLRFRPVRLLRWLLFLAVLLPVGGVLIHRLVPPPVTLLMVQRAVAGEGLDYRWRRLDRISPNLVRAVIAAEDARFCSHNGFDFVAIRKAMASNARHPGRVRGGSTISQQTAKNVFLWSGRSYLRKGLEAGYTGLIELFWSKRRIMEVYLNVVEWAPGVYGAQAAAQRWFHKDADALNPSEAARLAAILPKPLSWKAAGSGRYVRRRAGRIGASVGTVRADGLADCVLRPG